MKKIFFLFLCVILISCLAGCRSVENLIHVKAFTGDEITASLPPYNGLKAKVAIADFEVKSAKVTNAMGAGMQEMFRQTLSRSNRFLLVDQAEFKKEIKEQSLNAQSLKPAQEAKPKSAELIIAATVEEFEPHVSGGNSGLGGGGGSGSGFLGGLIGASSNKAHITLDIRIVNAATSEVLASSHIQGQAADAKQQSKTFFSKKWPLAASLSVYAKTPMEKAIRVCLIEALRYAVNSIPDEYYKYKNPA